MKLFGKEWGVMEKAGVYGVWDLLWRYTPACGDETVGICVHIPIVKELEMLRCSVGMKRQKWVDKLAQKRCLGKDSRTENLDARTKCDVRWKR